MTMQQAPPMSLIKLHGVIPRKAKTEHLADDTKEKVFLKS
jgi:hypothetical protein